MLDVDGECASAVSLISSHTHSASEAWVYKLIASSPTSRDVYRKLWSAPQAHLLLISLHPTAQTNCTGCPAHAVSAGGSALATDCRCIPGWEGEDGQECMACEPGEYKETFGSATCDKCAAGEYATVVQHLPAPEHPSGSLFGKCVFI